MDFKIDDVIALNKRFEALFSGNYEQECTYDGSDIDAAHLPDKAIPPVADIFSKMEEISSNLRRILYGESRQTESEQPQPIEDVLSLFKIEKPSQQHFLVDLEPALIVTNITDRCDQFIEQFSHYTASINAQICDKNRKSFSIIEKTLKARIKKFEKSLDRLPMESSSEPELKNQITYLLQKGFSELISDVIRPIAFGLRESRLYLDALTMFNGFLTDFGIYTRALRPGHKLAEDDWEIIDPQESSEASTDNREMKDVIKDVISFPYFFNDNRNDLLIREGEVIMWKVIA